MAVLTEIEKIADLEKQISDERQQIAADRMDVSIGELVNMYDQGELIIHPDYQRLFRWNDAQKTALIESILLGIPIPPIFVAEDENGIWEVVDGLQRLSTIVSFFGKLKSEVFIDAAYCNPEEDDDEIINSKNKWVLEKGDLLESLEGFNIDNLPQKFILNIKRSVCRVEILRGRSRVTLKYELFKRLNSNGTKLTAQEIRNAIYRSSNAKVIELVEKLSKNTAFIKLTSLSRQKIKELYNQELILRFMAFYDSKTVINSNTAKILDTFVESAVKDENFNYLNFETVFKRSINLLDSLDGVKVFENNNNAFVPAYFEAIMVGVARNIDVFENDKSLLMDKISKLRSSDEFKVYMGSASNSRKRIEMRLSISEDIFKVK